MLNPCRRMHCVWVILLTLVASGCGTPCAEEGVFAYRSDHTTITEHEMNVGYSIVVEEDDELNICPGEWTLTSWLISDGVVRVKGAGLGETTLIASGDANVPALHATGTGGAWISDLTLRGGSGAAGGAFASYLGDVRLERVRVTDASADVGGGLYAREDTTMELVDCVVDGNVARTAGGGAVVMDGATLISEGTNWSGEKDNEPDDLALLGADGTPVDSIELDDITSFQCHVEDGVCR
jgi:hypothetical protein